jgi:hypothetical protein
VYKHMPKGVCGKGLIKGGSLIGYSIDLKPLLSNRFQPSHDHPGVSFLTLY